MGGGSLQFQGGVPFTHAEVPSILSFTGSALEARFIIPIFVLYLFVSVQTTCGANQSASRPREVLWFSLLLRWWRYQFAVFLLTGG